MEKGFLEILKIVFFAMKIIFLLMENAICFINPYRNFVWNENHMLRKKICMILSMVFRMMDLLTK